MSVLNTNSRFLYDQMVLYAKRLTQTLPDKLNTCFFTNSGSEANDLALRLVHRHTGSSDMVILDHAYHGHTVSVIDISPYKFDKPSMDGKKEWIHVAPVPDTYRGKYRDVTDAGEKYANEVKKVISRAQANGRKIGGFILESMQSCGGQIIYPPGYMREAFRHVKEAGGLTICDEVQVGFGRVGTHFWAFQTQGDDIVPDIVTMGKPMGNGHPIAAVITTKEIADSLGKGNHQYFNTYGGNPVSCSIGLAVLDVIRDDKLQAHATRTGNLLMKKVRELAKRYPIVGDVRGWGMFCGIELVQDRKTKMPATAEAAYTIERLREMHILFSSEGPFENILKFKPPMVFDEGNVDDLVKALTTVFSELEKKGPLKISASHHLNKPEWQSKMLGLDDIKEDEENGSVNGGGGVKRKAPMLSPETSSSGVESPLVISDEETENAPAMSTKKMKFTTEEEDEEDEEDGVYNLDEMD
nr:5-phosphohydroxy-L-lysine phospho-lyase-like [Lytechinus pictus]